ncbi:hypothetical protein CVT25_008986 [Psilocybe cyanescens]|uniref:Uncharacterized protein n=1 Tax=Psilocybe cyanescens TaxID=93625 RepID=A0A409XNA1_PSICY|nr:hypothetical protein CVT25_008986 [Psilocybe cyanescens]
MEYPEWNQSHVHRLVGAIGAKAKDHSDSFILGWKPANAAMNSNATFRLDLPVQVNAIPG